MPPSMRPSLPVKQMRLALASCGLGQTLVQGVNVICGSAGFWPGLGGGGGGGAFPFPLASSASDGSETEIAVTAQTATAASIGAANASPANTLRYFIGTDPQNKEARRWRASIVGTRKRPPPQRVGAACCWPSSFLRASSARFCSSSCSCFCCSSNFLGSVGG